MPASSPLLAVSRTQGNNRALKAGEVTPSGYTLRFEEVPVLVHAFRRMVREQAFDVCEMALTTYLCAREHGAPITALPVFLVRGFHHGAIVRRAGAGRPGPGELAGQEIGVNRGYTVTTGVWARAILTDEHGLDPTSATWRPTGDEHVASYHAPDNVRPIDLGDDSLADLVAQGRLVAAVGITADDDERLEPVIDQPDVAALAAVRDRRLFPINHLVVVRDELLAADPGLGPALFEAFAESKQNYLDGLHDPSGDDTPSDRMYRAVASVTGEDPLPYGVEPNADVLDQLIGHAHAQRIITERPGPADIVAASTRELLG